MRCPHCHSTHIVKAGYKNTVRGRKPRRQCVNCGRTFYARRTK